MCDACGRENPNSSAFCGGCGHPLPLITTGDSPPASGGRPNPAQGALSTGNEARVINEEKRDPDFAWPSIDLTRVLTGDWFGAAVTAFASVATAALLSTGLVLLMWPEGLNARQVTVIIALVTSAAFGGDITAESRTEDAQLSVGAYPLTITILALTVAAMLISRQAERYYSAGGAILHVLRCALVLSVLLTGIGLSFRTHVRVPETFRGAPPAGDLDVFLPGLSGVRGTLAPNTAGTVVIGACLLIVVGAVAALRRDLAYPSAVVRARRWIALPLQGIAAIVVGSTLLGVGLGAAGIIRQDGWRNSSQIAALLATLPNIGLLGFFVGMGVAVRISTSSSEKLFRGHENIHLPSLADEINPWLWTLIGTTALIIIVSALWVALRSERESASANLLRWVVLLTLTAPYIAHLGDFHANVSQKQGGDRFWIRSVAGAHPWQALGLTFLWSFGAAIVAAGLVQTRRRQQKGEAIPATGSDTPVG